MAREVIADIDFGTSGIVSLGNVNQGLARLETQTVRTASVFANRMFNMRSAAMAFLGGFTVAGAIFAFKNFIADAARGNEHFKEMAASAKVFYETLLGIINDSPAMSAVIEGIAGGLIRASAELKVHASNWKLFWTDFKEFSRQVDEQIVKLIARRNELMAPKETPQFLTMMTESWAEFNDAGRDAWRTWTNFRDIVNESSTIIVEDLDTITASLDTLQEKLAIVQAAGASVGQALAQAFLEGGISLREALAQVLKQVAISLFVKAGEYFALGLAALTPWGAATLGPAPMYFKAAGAFAAAGAAVGSFGIGVGGRGEARAGGSTGGGFAPASPASRQLVINNNITIEGNTTEDTVDDIIDAIETRLKDGVSGGDFGGQLVRRNG